MNERRVITFGTFDLLHVGHVRLLQTARALGDSLVVGVSADDLNWSKKRAISVIAQNERMEMIGALRCVSEAFLETALDLKPDYIKQYDATIMAMGSDWTGEYDWLRSICNVVYLPRTMGVSTSEIKRKAQYL